MKEDLLIRFLNGKCTEEETEQVKNWIRENGRDEEIENLLKSRWERSEDHSDLKERHFGLLNSIHNKMGKDQQTLSFPEPTGDENETQSRSFSFLKIAASIIFFVCAAVFGYQYFFKNSSTPTEAIATIIRQTGVGEKLTVVLPDSSVVILNSSSTLEFPAAFAENERAVKISGEGFFSVAHESNRPFIVTSGDMTTTVLGTKFNVKSTVNGVNVALAEGKVKLGLHRTQQSAMLAPGQMGSSDNTRKDINVEQVDIEKIIAWKQRIVELKSSSLEDVFENLEKWYGVEIAVAKNVNTSKKVSGKFNNDNLQDILSGLAFSLNFEYSMTGNKVSVKKN
jgi:transmembrane sensor